MTAIKKDPPSWPVVEIFGPTIQGEGVDQGVVSHFVRFGGCDYRCVWCDTPHAVIPAEVRKNATKMTAGQIGSDLVQLGKAPWIILTGGNPALLDLTDLIEHLHNLGYLVAVETQGSRWRDWMRDLDRVCVSPKPPSAEQQGKESQLQRFFEEGLHRWSVDDRMYQWMFFKVVVFNDEDLDFAETIRAQLSNQLLYLSAGNDAGRTVGQPERTDNRRLAGVRRDLLDHSRWLTEEVFKRPSLCVENVIVQTQQHVALWGNEVGR